jgi:hypothetical protein
MTTKNTVEKMDHDKVREWLSDTDGYSILSPEFFSKMGLEFKSETFKNDPAMGKHSVTPNDGGAQDVQGVAEFDAIEWVADILEVPDKGRNPWMGRGKNFRHLVSLVLEKLDK